ncbi:MAG: FKBP-type peptidyl-prolyl cis-trans isomerase [Longibaculum sp.]
MKKLGIAILCLMMLWGCSHSDNQKKDVVNENGIEVKNGDVVKIDFVGKLNGKAFANGSAKNQIVELGAGNYIDGFEEQIVGMKTGSQKTITVTFPKNYGSSDLAGKECTFDITLHNVYKDIKESAGEGDIVVIDYVGKLDGQVFQGGSANHYLLELGSGQFVPGFEDQLMGSKTGESKTIKITFPANYGSTFIGDKEVSLANQEVTFDVSINHVLRVEK